MIKGFEICISDSNIAVDNLALEEFFFSCTDRNILLLAENNPAIVIGRFQNPWRECRTGLAARLGIPVIRRVSGGGTVVHGLGNLHWSLISSRPLNKVENLKNMAVALTHFGIQITQNDRYDLLLNCRGHLYKVSGSAFRQTARRNLHHGTMLVDADLKVLGELLNVLPRDMDAKGVVSTKSTVRNLTAAKAALTVKQVCQAIANEWQDSNNATAVSPADYMDNPEYLGIRDRLLSWEWNWGRTADFVERFKGLSGFGRRVLECRVEGGRIAQALPFLVNRRYHGYDILVGQKDGPEWLKELAKRVDGDV